VGTAHSATPDEPPLVADIINGKIEIFSKHQRFLIATESSKYLLIFVPSDYKLLKENSGLATLMQLVVQLFSWIICQSFLFRLG
jgi:hypothetical protein